jgi:hypothetical protein
LADPEGPNDDEGHTSEQRTCGGMAVEACQLARDSRARIEIGARLTHNIDANRDTAAPRSTAPTRSPLARHFFCTLMICRMAERSQIDRIPQPGKANRAFSEIHREQMRCSDGTLPRVISLP